MSLPSLADFTLIQPEQDAVDFALAQTDCSPWDIEKINSSQEVKDHLTEVKKKILRFHLAAQKNQCCYCHDPLEGDYTFIVDREHILPKRKFRDYTYSIWNLSTACKRCNMSYKGESTDFVESLETITTDAQNNTRYKFVHPNFDCWNQHLFRFSVQISTGNENLTLYRYKTEKGKYTYDFFDFKSLEVSRFDEAQGNSAIDPYKPLIEKLIDEFMKS